MLDSFGYCATAPYMKPFNSVKPDKVVDEFFQLSTKNLNEFEFGLSGEYPSAVFRGYTLAYNHQEINIRRNALKDAFQWSLLQ